MESPPQPLSLDRFGAPVRIDATLVEEAVLLGVERAPAERRRQFRAERNPIYELDRPQQREERFERLHARWFDILGLGEPLLALLAEQPSIARSISACLVVPAARRRDEHADLRESRGSESSARGRPAVRSAAAEPPVLIVQLLPTTLVESDRLGRLLRRELTYVADMLDPEFGYDPAAAVEETSGPLASVVRERYELLWRVVVDGRLAAAGYLREGERERLRSRFCSVFPMLGMSGAKKFETLFEADRPSHGQLMRLARNPRRRGSGASDLCPLCGMPSPRERLERAALPEAVITAVRRDFADWLPEDGMCPHCADLYDLRHRARPSAGFSRPSSVPE